MGRLTPGLRTGLIVAAGVAAVLLWLAHRSSENSAATPTVSAAQATDSAAPPASGEDSFAYPDSGGDYAPQPDPDLSESYQPETQAGSWQTAEERLAAAKAKAKQDGTLLPPQPEQEVAAARDTPEYNARLAEPTLYPQDLPKP